MGKTKHNWREKVAAYHASGQSQKDWCAKNGVNIHTLKFWLQKEKADIFPKETCQWLPVNFSESESTIENQALTLKIGRVFIEIKPGFNPELLTNVVKTLITIC